MPPLEGTPAEVQPEQVEGQGVGESAQVQQGQGVGEAGVQPSSQGQEQDTTTGLYDLSSVPEQYRADVERIAKDIDRNVNTKLQEAADFRKTWEPYEELGLDGVEPEGLSALLDFVDALEDPDTAKAALLQLAERVGVDLGVTSTDAPADEADPLETRLERLERERAEERAATERAALEAEEAQRLQAEWRAVEESNGRPFTDDEAEQLRELAQRFVTSEDEPIKAAWAFIKNLRGQAEDALIAGTPNQPTPAEAGGRASSVPVPPQTFEEAEALLTERRSRNGRPVAA